MEKLKPCPFCGGEATVFQIPQNTTAEMYEHPQWMWKNPGMWVVGCDTSMCIGNINNMSLVFWSRSTAVAAWNRRANDEH